MSYVDALRETPRFRSVPHDRMADSLVIRGIMTDHVGLVRSVIERSPRLMTLDGGGVYFETAYIHEAFGASDWLTRTPL